MAPTPVTPGKFGFKPISGKPKYRLIVTSEGEPKSGKNHFAFGMPGPIGLHRFESGDEGVVEKFVNGRKESGSTPAIAPKAIFGADYAIKVPDGPTIQQVSDLASPAWGAFKANFAVGLAKYRSTIVDTGTDAWEMVRMSHFGKLQQVLAHHYAPVNSEFKSLFHQAFSSEGNLLILHRYKDEYQTKSIGGKEVSNKTGVRLLAGYKDTKFESQVHLRHFRDTDGFHTEIMECRQNPDVVGYVLDGDMNNFQALGMLVYPDSTEADWS